MLREKNGKKQQKHNNHMAKKKMGMGKSQVSRTQNFKALGEKNDKRCTVEL